jgi:transcriptional antiterminator NusG
MHYYSDFWHVFFVKTGKEAEALEEVARAFSRDEVKPFLPYVENLFRKNGMAKRERQLMFPGYLFVETSIVGDEFWKRSAKCIQKSESIMRLLLHCNSEQASVTDEERKAIQELWVGDERGIAASQGVIEGDKVAITEGSLVGMEAIIKKIDRHKLKAEVEIDFLGKAHRITVGLEIIKRSIP